MRTCDLLDSHRLEYERGVQMIMVYRSLKYKQGVLMIMVYRSLKYKKDVQMIVVYISLKIEQGHVSKWLWCTDP